MNAFQDFKSALAGQESGGSYTMVNTHNYIGKYVGQTINGVLITESGLIAGAHLKGPTGLRKYLESNGENDVTDGFGTPISSYIRDFGGYDVSPEITGRTN